MEYVIKLTENDLKILDEALVQMPYGKVFLLIDKINTQIIEQERDINQDHTQQKNS